jgi:hypothetical protein
LQTQSGNPAVVSEFVLCPFRASSVIDLEVCLYPLGLLYSLRSCKFSISIILFTLTESANPPIGTARAQSDTEIGACQAEGNYAERLVTGMRFSSAVFSLGRDDLFKAFARSSETSRLLKAQQQALNWKRLRLVQQERWK